jgi:hypothetical protein
LALEDWARGVQPCPVGSIPKLGLAKYFRVNGRLRPVRLSRADTILRPISGPAVVAHDLTHLYENDIYFELVVKTC